MIGRSCSSGQFVFRSVEHRKRICECPFPIQLQMRCFWGKSGRSTATLFGRLNAMLLNEFLKEHRKVKELEATVAAQQKGFESQIAALTAALKAQATQIQKVSDKLRTQTPAPRGVAND